MYLNHVYIMWCEIISKGLAKTCFNRSSEEYMLLFFETQLFKTKQTIIKITCTVSIIINWIVRILRHVVESMNTPVHIPAAPVHIPEAPVHIPAALVHYTCSTCTHTCSTCTLYLQHLYTYLQHLYTYLQHLYTQYLYTYLHFFPALSLHWLSQQGSMPFLVWYPASHSSSVSSRPFPQNAPSPWPSVTMETK